MNDSQMIDFIEEMKIEPDFKSETFDPLAFDFISTTVKPESRCYIKEEIDIPPDEANNTDYNYLSKADFNLNDRVCSIIIERIPDSVLQKYCSNKIPAKVITNRCDRSISQSITEVQHSIINSKENSVIENIVHESVDNCENSNTQLDNLETNGNQKIKKIISRKNEDYQRCTELCRCYCPTCHKMYKPSYTPRKCTECKMRLLLECKKCYKLLTSYRGMMLHIQHECTDNQYYYECFECNYKSSIMYNVARHLRSKHPNSLIYDRIKRIKKQEMNLDPNELTVTNKCLTFGREFGVDMLVKHMQVCPKGFNEHIRNYTRSKRIMKRHCPKCQQEVMVSVKETASVQDKKLCNKCHIAMNFKCTRCTRQYSDCNGIIHHIIKSHFDKQYTCSECTYKAPTLSYLSVHYNKWHGDSTVHGGEGSRSEKEVNIPSFSREDLQKSKVGCHYQCEHPDCSYEASNQQSLFKHVVEVHISECKIAICPKCYKVLKNKSYLVEHLNICRYKDHFLCDHCHYKAKSKDLIRRHLYLHHRTTNPKYQDFEFNKGLENQNILLEILQIIKLEHTYPLSPSVIPDTKETNEATELDYGEKIIFTKKTKNHSTLKKISKRPTLQCGNPNCCFIAANQQSLQQHIAEVHISEYKTVSCPRCYRVLRHKSRLAEHLNNKCLYKDDFLCDYCSYKANSKNLIEEHLSRFHKDKVPKYHKAYSSVEE